MGGMILLLLTSTNAQTGETGKIAINFDQVSDFSPAGDAAALSLIGRGE
jgi:hypothetical protein